MPSNPSRPRSRGADNGSRATPCTNQPTARRANHAPPQPHAADRPTGVRPVCQRGPTTPARPTAPQGGRTRPRSVGRPTRPAARTRRQGPPTARHPPAAPAAHRHRHPRPRTAGQKAAATTLPVAGDAGPHWAGSGRSPAAAVARTPRSPQSANLGGLTFARKRLVFQQFCHDFPSVRHSATPHGGPRKFGRKLLAEMMGGEVEAATPHGGPRKFGRVRPIVSHWPALAQRGQARSGTNTLNRVGLKIAFANVIR